MALCLIVFVPIFLYALFLDDLQRYSLDAQETALTTPWDFTVQDYSRPLPTADTKNPGGGNTAVQKHARLMFCDHESGLDSYRTKTYSGEDDKPVENYPDCQETNHHQALAAHVCWLNDNAKQVTCAPPEKAAGKLDDALHDSYRNAFTHGGLIQCEARAVVENYLLPKKLFAQFSRVNLTKEQWQGQGSAIHTNSQKGTDDNAYFLRQEQLALLTDTWALSEPEDVRPGERPAPREPSVKTPARRLLPQMVLLYRHGEPFRELNAATQSFFPQASNSQLLLPKLPGGADDPREPNLAIAPQQTDDPSEKIDQEQGTASYFHTEWRDWERDGHREAWRRRAAGYLGCKPGEGC